MHAQAPGIPSTDNILVGKPSWLGILDNCPIPKIAATPGPTGVNVYGLGPITGNIIPAIQFSTRLYGRCGENTRACAGRPERSAPDGRGPSQPGYGNSQCYGEQVGRCLWVRPVARPPQQVSRLPSLASSSHSGTAQFLSLPAKGGVGQRAVSRRGTSVEVFSYSALTFQAANG